MAQRGIREYDAKKMLAKYWTEYISKDFTYPGKLVLVDPDTDLDKLPEKHPWLEKEKLVAKPDQLFGKRGKHGLIKLNASYDEIKKWIKEKMNKEVTISSITDKLTHFLIEPFVPHKNEYYVAIKSNREGDTIYFSNHGGVDIESVWDTVAEIQVDIDEDINRLDIGSKLPKDTPEGNKKIIADFIRGLFKFYAD
ncbi:MAG: ATPase, partial [Thermoplasmata archaeon]|nr:ATPase [Thermoplasmata archaeon]